MSLAASGYWILTEEGATTLVRRGASRVSRAVKGRAYRVGSGRACPICAFTGRKFLPAGRPPRPEARCPGCRALERHRLLWHYLANGSDLLAGDQTVLYFAPRRPILARLRAMGHRVVTTDPTSAGVDLRGDITRLPLEAAAVDLVLCVHVLEHVPDDRAAMAELHRVLADDGVAVVMVPKDPGRIRTHEDPSITAPAARRAAFGQADHVRVYGQDVVMRLVGAGFDVEVVSHAEDLPEAAVDRFGLAVRDGDGRRTEDIHVCRACDR